VKGRAALISKGLLKLVAEGKVKVTDKQIRIGKWKLVEKRWRSE